MVNLHMFRWNETCFIFNFEKKEKNNQKYGQVSNHLK